MEMPAEGQIPRQIGRRITGNNDASDGEVATPMTPQAVQAGSTMRHSIPRGMHTCLAALAPPGTAYAPLLLLKQRRDPIKQQCEYNNSSFIVRDAQRQTMQLRSCHGRSRTSSGVVQADAQSHGIHTTDYMTINCYTCIRLYCIHRTCIPDTMGCLIPDT